MNYEQFKLNSLEQARSIIGKTGLYGVSKKQLWWKHNAYLRCELTTDKIISIDVFNNTLLYQPNSTSEIFSRKFDELYFMEINEENKENAMNEIEIPRNSTLKYVMPVYETTDYSIFKMSDGENNRTIKEYGVKPLMRNIKTEGYHYYEPIIVNENMEVIDGQHRLEACKRLGEPVLYGIQKDLTVNHAVKFNETRRNWNKLDYLNVYANAGNPVYIMIRDLYEKHKDNHSVMSIASALCGNSARFSLGRESNSICFSGGNLKQKFTFESADKSLVITDKILKLHNRRAWLRVEGTYVVVVLSFLNDNNINLDVLYSKIEGNFARFTKHTIHDVNTLLEKLRDIYYIKSRIPSDKQFDFKGKYTDFKNESYKQATMLRMK